MSAVAERPLTQKQVVLRLLREHPEGICVADVPREVAYTLRNRCSELSHEGHAIVVRRCRFHTHKAAVVRYSLSASPEQLEIPA